MGNIMAILYVFLLPIGLIVLSARGVAHLLRSPQKTPLPDGLDPGHEPRGKRLGVLRCLGAFALIGLALALLVWLLVAGVCMMALNGGKL